MASIKCDDCKNIMTEFVEVKGIDYLTNKPFYEDVPYCGYCFEQETEKARLKTGIYKTNRRNKDYGIHK